MSAFVSFLDELKRRHVYRVAVAYAAIGWLLVQVITQVFPVFSLPLWIQKTSVLLVLGGFPIALVWAWGREAALRRAQANAAGVASLHRRGVDMFLLLALVLAFGLVAALWSAQGVLSRTAPATTAEGGSVPVGVKSIAVLPFENLSPDCDNAYFADGMQEQILTQLTRLSGLKTISRTSTEKYASHPEDVKVIGRQLGVSNVLEGSVQKAGNEARISLQLIDTATDAQIWAETYDRSLDNVFTVESEVAAQVANALQVKLLPKERQELARAPTRNPLAYQALLRGEAAQQRAEVSWKKPYIDAAIGDFRAAVSDDPRFALAWARLGYAYAYALHRVPDVDRDAVKQKSRDAFGRALALDADLPEAHVAAGYYHVWAEHDFAAAREQFKEALADGPRNANAQMALGDAELALGQMDDAELAYRRATDLDPRNVQAWQSLAWLLGDRRRYAEADRILVKALAIDGHAGLTWGMRNVLSYMATGNGAVELAMVKAAPRDVQANPNHLIDRALALKRSHDYTAALKLFDASKGSAYRASTLCGWRADTEWSAGKRDDAKAEYAHCVDLVLADPDHENDATACADLGWFHARLGRAQDASREGQRAADLLPVSRAWNDGADILHNLASIEAQLGEADKAVAILDQLLSNDHGTTDTVATVRSEDEWDPIRGTPQFRQLLKRHAGAPK